MADEPHPRPVASEAQAARRFWSRHARLGTALSLAVLAQAALYAGLAPGVPQRRLLLTVTAAGVVLTVAVAMVVPVALNLRHYRWLFYGWSLAATTVILVAAALDGGDESPLAVALFLTLLYAALAYPPAAVLAIGLLEAAGYVAVAATDGTASTAFTAVVTSTLCMAALMATRGARNRADQAAQLQSLTRRLWDQATRDDLTGCLNRRGLEIALETSLAQVARRRRSLAMLLIDVDRLKEINDTSGHGAGDSALRVVAAALAVAGRRSDVVARVGGDEFVVLAPDSDRTAATQLAARIHDSLHRLSGDGAITVSIGISAMRGHGDPARLMAMADTALYDAKHAGRNCTRVFSVATQICV